MGDGVCTCCCAVTTIILSVVIVLLIIGIFLAIFLPLVPPVLLDGFTAEYDIVFLNGDADGIRRNSSGVDYSFTSSRWATETFTTVGGKKKAMTRIYATDTEKCILCANMSNHASCSALSLGGGFAYMVPSGATYLGYASCKGLVPGRNLDLCDVYTYTGSDGLTSVKAVVERGTSYPVVETTVNHDGSGAVISQKTYTKFTPEKPKDESVLKPLVEGTTIYDFRDGKGDSNGGSNVLTNTKEKISVPFMTRLARMLLPAKLLFALNGDKVSQTLKEIEKMRSIAVASSSFSKRDEAGIQIRDDIPESFDARTYFSDCSAIISNIVDQGKCGSCWAMSSASVLSDRYCIKKGGRVNLAPQYLVYCAPHNNGCSGAENAIGVWEDIIEIGIPPASCVPFVAHNGECPSRCVNGDLINETILIRPTGYHVPFDKDAKKNVQAIQSEIMNNGPVTANYFTFSDFGSFFSSSTKVYHRSKDAKRGGAHAVRIIGWGKDGSEDYWLIANSWGTSLDGKEYPNKGVFKMRRGNNECNIEQQVSGGVF